MQKLREIDEKSSEMFNEVGARLIERERETRRSRQRENKSERDTERQRRG